MLKQFPTLEDRRYIHFLINQQAKGKISRNTMMDWIAEIVEKYGLDHMPIFNYSVQVMRSKHYPQPIIHIKGAQLSDKCPTCEKTPDEYGKILNVEKENHDLDYDIVNVTCLNCGCIYSVKGVKPGASKLADYKW